MTMTKEQKDNLFVLIKSLSKSEKRQFKLYVGRLGVNEDSKFLMLFNILDKLVASIPIFGPNEVEGVPFS